MSVYRVPLLLGSIAGMHISLTNPNPPIPKEEEISEPSVTPKGNIVLYWPIAMKVVYWALGLSESAVIISSQFSYPPLTERLLSSLVPKPAWSISRVQVTPQFLAGCLLAAAGTYLRLQSFRTLGRLFTYQLSIRKEHHLVTSGPYSIIRHPAYTSGWLIYGGINLCVFGPGSWLKECGWLDTASGRALMSTAAAVGAIVSVFIMTRVTLEDKLMKNEFGEQWDDWARKVPYRLIPFVF